MGFRATLDPLRRPARPFAARPGFSYRTKLVKDAVRYAKSLLDTLRNLPGIFRGEVRQTSFAGGIGNGMFMFHSSSGLSGGAPNPAPGPREFRQRIQRVISSSNDNFLSEADVSAIYSRMFREEIAGGRTPEWDVGMYRDIVQILYREKRIEALPNFSVRVYNQTAHLLEIGYNLSVKLSSCTTLRDIAGIVHEEMRKAFGVVDLYYRSNSSFGSEIKIVSGDNISASTFVEWRIPEEGSAFAGTVTDERVTLISNLLKDSRVSPADREKYQGRFKSPREMMFCSDGRGFVTFKLAEWVLIGNEGEARALLNPSANVSEIKGAISSIADIVGNKVAEIIGSRSVREVWDSESALEAVPPRSIAPPHAAKSQGIPAASDRYLPASTLIPIVRKDINGTRRTFTFEIIQKPAQSITQERHDEVIDQLTKSFIDSLSGKIKGEIDGARIRTVVADGYFKPATHIAVIRENGKVVGFSALARYVVDGEQIVRITGTYLARNVEGFGFSGRINYYLFGMVLRELGRKFKFVTRTSNPAAFGALMGASNRFPDPSNPKALPSADAIRATSVVSRETAAEVPFDERTFLSPGAFEHAFGVVYDKGKIDLHSDPNVNRFMTRDLNYDRGDAFWVYGEISSFVLRMFIVRDAWKQVKKWFERVRNRFSRSVILH